MKNADLKNIAQQQTFKRFDLQFRIQHMVLFTSTITLIITGIPLWLSLGGPGHIWCSQEVIQAFGGLEAARIIHRWAAAVLIAVSVYHLFYSIISRRGRREFIELLPRIKDVTDVTHNFMYFFGLRKTRPQFRRYSYYEKFDYWAVYWGCVIMIGTGGVLWFPRLAEKCIPWLSYELALEVHADEAILAALALFVWHFYNVHFNPSRFPGTLLWWHGKISREEMLRDHPLELEKLAQEGQAEQLS